MAHRNTRIRSTEETRKVFGKKLLDAIRDANMNQSDLARRLGVTKDAISSYVRGRCLPKDETMVAICSELGIKEEELLPRRYDESPNTPSVKLISVGDGSGNYFVSINVTCTLQEANNLISNIPRGSDVIDSE
jgi:transcriptional regulator with XRE-family HTH domain